MVSPKQLRQTDSFYTFHPLCANWMPRTRSECIRLDRRVSRVRRRRCSLKSPKKVNGTSEMARIVARLVSAGAGMVASDGQDIISMIINHLLRSACTIDLKSSVDTCGKLTGFLWLIPWTGRRQIGRLIPIASKNTQRFHALYRYSASPAFSHRKPFSIYRYLRLDNNQ